MSKIDDLIRQLCPEGVPKARIRDLMTRGKGVPVTAAQMKTLSTGNARVRVFAGGQTYVDVDSNSSVGNMAHQGPGIIVRSRGIIAFTFWDGLFTHKNELWSYLPKNDSVDIKFVYYLLSSQTQQFIDLAKSKSVKMPQLTVDDTDLYRIPVPPLEVQREIVSILDKFTQLEAELEAELEARRTQYEVTRDRLLDFSSDLDAHPLREMIRELSPNGVSIKPLGQIGEFIRGSGLEKKDLQPIGEPVVHYGEIHTKYGYWAESTISFVDSTHARKMKKAKPGDVVLVTTSENLEDVGKPLAWLGVDDLNVGGESYIFKSDFDPLYLAQVFLSSSFKQSSRSHISGTKVKRLSSRSLEKIEVAVPPLEIQREIGQMLRSMDGLLRDVSIGLPAEISARRKQYEYYRNKLLTFKELDVA